jgi:hypothetical protein
MRDFAEDLRRARPKPMTADERVRAHLRERTQLYAQVKVRQMTAEEEARERERWGDVLRPRRRTIRIKQHDAKDDA